MKKLFQFLLLFFSVTIATAQNEEMNEKFWDGSQVSNTQIPEKWQNESAVILYQEYLYDYHKYGFKVIFSRSIRKRIMLLDQAAVNDFSEFTFVKNFSVGRGYFWKKGTKTVGVISISVSDFKIFL